MATALNRSKGNPYTLKTAPGTSAYAMYADEKDGKTTLVCRVGSTHLHYDARCIDDLHAMLKKTGDWVELGGTDEQKPAKEGTVEAWGRSPNNHVGGWYGLKRGAFGDDLASTSLGSWKNSDRASLNTMPRTIACVKSRTPNPQVEPIAHLGTLRIWTRA